VKGTNKLGQWGRGQAALACPAPTSVLGNSKFYNFFKFQVQGFLDVKIIYFSIEEKAFSYI
jgi:hypothetical protein